MIHHITKRFIIDTDVARGAGGIDSEHATSKNCSLFLQVIRTQTKHKIAMTAHIRDEWDKHQSTFARMWLKKMIASGRFEFVRPELELELQERLRDLFESAPNQQAAVAKDFHLVEAAFSADRMVISMDETMRRLLGKAVVEKGVRELSVILWINPDKAEDQALHWLHAGAPHEEPRCLGYLPDA